MTTKYLAKFHLPNTSSFFLFRVFVLVFFWVFSVFDSFSLTSTWSLSSCFKLSSTTSITFCISSFSWAGSFSIEINGYRSFFLCRGLTNFYLPCLDSVPHKCFYFFIKSYWSKTNYRHLIRYGKCGLWQGELKIGEKN